MMRISWILGPLALLVLAGWSRAEDWPQFRGPRGDGTSEAAGLPVTWGPSTNIRWRTHTPGRGRSSPIVSGDGVWITTADEWLASPEVTARRLFNHPDPTEVYVASRVTLKVMCLDRESGKIRYDVELFQKEEPEPAHRLNSFATPTPIVEAGRVYCDFGGYGTACVDAASGRVLWKTRVPAEHLIAPGSSPALFGDRLILVRDGADAQYVAALDSRTGEPAWKTPRPPLDGKTGNEKKSFSTPLVIQWQGRAQAVIPGAQWFCAYDPRSGAEIWRVRHGKQFSLASRPVFGHGMVYVVTGPPRAQLWAIRPDGQGDVTQTHVVWRVKTSIPTMSSPILVGNEIYCVSDTGIVSCLNALTGKEHWRQRIGDNYTASPIAAEGRLYFFSREGETTVIQAGKQYAELAVNQLEGPIIATPAAAGKALFVRTDSHVYRIEHGAAPGKPGRYGVSGQ